MLSLTTPGVTQEEASAHRWRNDFSAESRELKRVVLKAVAFAILLVGGWLIFYKFLPAMIKPAFEHLAVPQVRSIPAPVRFDPVMSQQIPTSPVITGPSAEELALQRRVQAEAATALQKKKDLAWAAFYTPGPSCEHPADWSAQVECGNQYMRAKKVFEKQWDRERSANTADGSAVVPDNGSVRGLHK